MSTFEIALTKAKKSKSKSVPAAVSQRQVIVAKIDQPHLKNLLTKQKKRPLPKTMEGYKDNDKVVTTNKYIKKKDIKIKS